MITRLKSGSIVSKNYAETPDENFECKQEIQKKKRRKLNIPEEEMEMKNSWLDLPSEILISIFLFMQYFDVVSLECVCSRFYQVSSESSFLWSQMYKYHFKQEKEAISKEEFCRLRRTQCYLCGGPLHGRRVIEFLCSDGKRFFLCSACNVRYVEVISKTVAKRSYGISENEINALPSRLQRNPKYPSQIMQAHIRKNVEYFAESKYFSIGGLEKYLQEKELKSLRRRQKAMER